jgi:L-threonylcarbamoyladenylate synthase
MVDAEEIRRAAEALRQGLLVILPTDTVYGVAAHPSVPAAVERLFAVKGREAGKPVPLLAGSVEDVEGYGAEFTGADRRLAAAFWPGPLTIVLNLRRRNDGRQEGGAGGRTEGFRVPRHDTALALLAAAGGILRVTSANLSGEPPALTARDAQRALAPHACVVLDAGPAPGGVASSVVKVVGESIEILREGAVPREDILRVAFSC